MFCRNCGSRIIFEAEHNDKQDLEMVCIKCGRRTFIDRKSRLAEWLKARMK